MLILWLREEVTRLPSYIFLIIGKYKQTAEIKLVEGKCYNFIFIIIFITILFTDKFYSDVMRHKQKTVKSYIISRMCVISDILQEFVSYALRPLIILDNYFISLFLGFSRSFAYFISMRSLMASDLMLLLAITSKTLWLTLWNDLSCMYVQAPVYDLQ
jgi:hypothetical protein